MTTQPPGGPSGATPPQNDATSPSGGRALVDAFRGNRTTGSTVLSRLWRVCTILALCLLLSGAATNTTGSKPLNGGTDAEAPGAPSVKHDVDKLLTEAREHIATIKGYCEGTGDTDAHYLLGECLYKGGIELVAQLLDQKAFDTTSPAFRATVAASRDVCAQHGLLGEGEYHEAQGVLARLVVKTPAPQRKSAEVDVPSCEVNWDCR